MVQICSTSHEHFGFKLLCLNLNEFPVEILRKLDEIKYLRQTCIHIFCSLWLHVYRLYFILRFQDLNWNFGTEFLHDSYGLAMPAASGLQHRPLTPFKVVTSHTFAYYIILLN